MNRIYLCIICFCFLMDHVNAQVVYERTFPFEFPSIQFPIELSDTSTVSLGTNNECGGIGVRHIDALGNELEEDAFWAEAFSSGIYWIGHDSVLIWAEEGAYDVGPDSFRVYIWTPAEIRKILSSDIRNQFSNPRLYGAFLYSPDRLVFEKTDTLYSKNLQNDQIEDSLIIPGIISILEFEKAILVFSQTAAPLLLDDHLTEIIMWHDTTSLPFSINEANVLDSFLVGRSGFTPNAIAIINVYSETKGEVDLSPYLNLVEDVQVNKSHLFVKGVLNQEHYVIELDGQFQIVEIHKIDFPDLDFDLTYRYFPDRVYAWGLNGLARYNANYRMSYKYKDPHPVEYIDIALDTMWVDSVVNYAPQYFVIYIKAVVRNLSLQVVHSVSMHYEEIPIFFCDPGVYGGTFEHLNIQPNETDTVSLVLFAYQVGSPYTQRFYVHHGNHHLDEQSANNDYNLVHILSNSTMPLSSSYQVYPNPFSDILRTSIASDGVELVLYDQTGRIVSQGNDQLNDLRWLGSGVYYLRISNGISTSIQKVVKVE